MFKFFLKKNFADIWDNLYHLLIVNLVYIALGVISFFSLKGIFKLPLDDSMKNLIMIPAVFLLSALVHVFIFAQGKNCEKISKYEKPRLEIYFGNLKSSIKDGILYGLFVALLFVVAVVSIPYYFNMWLPAGGEKGNFMGLLCMALVFWAELISLLALQWFLPIRNLLHNDFKKCLKKSYIIFFDNLGLSIALAFVGLVNLLISIFTVGLVPGLSGLQLTVTDALRLRLYKYDWYEVNPGMTKEQRKEIPWDDLLASDKKLLGNRSIKSYLFPWKNSVLSED